MKRSSVGRLAAEGVVIVVSVLVALAADAWWADRQEAALAREYLFALQRDFEQMSERLDSSLAYTARAMEAGSSLLEDLSGGTPEIAADSGMAQALSLLGYEAFSPSTGAYDALVSAGALELLEATVLKQALADFFGGFEDLRASERMLQDAQNGFILTEDFGALVGVHRLLVPLNGGPPGTVPERARRWARSDALLNGIALIWARQMGVQKDYRFLQEALVRIQGMLEEELT